MSLAKGRTTSGLEEAGKKRSGTISGVLSGSLQSTGKKLEAFIMFLFCTEKDDLAPV